MYKTIIRIEFFFRLLIRNRGEEDTRGNKNGMPITLNFALFREKIKKKVTGINRKGST